MMKKKKVVHSSIIGNAHRILRFLERNGKLISPLLILTHDYPDPDALASAFALHHLANTRFGFDSRIAYGGIIGRVENRAMVRILQIPVHKLGARDLKAYAHIATVDTQPAFANNSFPKGCRAALVIDQHLSEISPDARLSIIDTQCGATSVIMAQCLLQTGRNVPARLATALVYGILSDTQDFYRCHHPDVLQTYLRILEYADLKMLAQIQNPSQTREFFTTLQQGIHNAMVRRGLVVSCLGVVKNPDLVSLVSDFLLTYRGTSWSFCLGRYKEKLYFSLRGANANFQAADVLRDICEDRGQAGGHDTIAGGSVKVEGSSGDLDWEAAEKGLIDRLGKRLRIPLKSRFYRPFRWIEKSK
ncbi:MAG: DHH family phosphoesterase [Candidatus Omnitrophota bacterium]